MISLFTILSLIPTVEATLDWEVTIQKAQEFATAGIFGLLDTDILFAEPGTTQREWFRILQSLLGIGSLRVIFKIGQYPCLRFLHKAFGIKPPEAHRAREFWLNQESWTQMSGLGMTIEDTSYHRINQGCGPQAKILWDEKQIQEEKNWWEVQTSGSPVQTDTSADTDPLPNLAAAATNVTGCFLNACTSEADAEELGENNSWLRPRPKTDGQANSLHKEEESRAVAPDIFRTRSGEGISAGTTDKWWMDRWQCEVLAVASIHHLSVTDSCTILTNAYFGTDIGVKRHLYAGIGCSLLTIITLLTAIWTKWSWIAQFFALSSLGYFLNWTCCLRSWRFTPNSALRDCTPSLLYSWPKNCDGLSIIRIALQNARVCHLRTLVSLPRDKLNEAKAVAKKMRGRYKSPKEIVKDVPYSKEGSISMQWLSYEVQTSYYGLLASVEPDHAARRTYSCIVSIVVSAILLTTGFGASIPDGLSPFILGIYCLGFAGAIYGRGRTAEWTMPEFEAVDLTIMQYPSMVKDRIWKLKEVRDRFGKCDLDV